MQLFAVGAVKSLRPSRSGNGPGSRVRKRRNQKGN
nr:MAG TPA: hypothetical protein [Caudoviricetes sp.]